jgi:drug/metabolite transporter (DMT)-like permease
LTLTGLRLIGKDASSNDSGSSALIAGNAIAFLVCLPIALPVSHASITDVAVLLYLGIFQIALAYIFLTRSLREVPGLEAATLLLIEPVFNPVWTWIVHGERPGDFALIGGALIIGAVFFGTIWQARQGGLRYVG